MAINPFKPNDIVKTINSTRVNGVIRFVACVNATLAGGKTCDKKTCTHNPKEKIWVKWPNVATLMTYDHTELAFDVSSAPTATTAPSDKQPETDRKETKDEYIDKAKEAIKEVVKEQNKSIDDFWARYNGFHTLRYDRSGRPYIKDDEHKQKVIEEKDIDFQKYNGFSHGPAKKVGL